MGAGECPAFEPNGRPDLGLARRRRPIRSEFENMHRVGQSWIEQAIVPDRRLASGAAWLQFAHLARNAIAPPALLERQDAFAVVEQRGRERSAGRQHGHEPVAEGIWLLKIVGLEKGQRALINIARVRRLASPDSGRRPCSPRAPWGSAARSIAGAISRPDASKTRGRMPGDGRPPSSRMATCRIRHCQARK